MKTRLAGPARQQADRIDCWWRENRAAARDLFAREFAEARALLAAMPEVGGPYIERHGVLVRWRHLAGGVLVDPVQAHERVEDEQPRLQLRDCLVEARAVGLEIEAHRRRRDHLNVQVRERHGGGGADPFETAADDVERVLGGVEQHPAGAGSPASQPVVRAALEPADGIDGLHHAVREVVPPPRDVIVPVGLLHLVAGAIEAATYDVRGGAAPPHEALRDGRRDDGDDPVQRVDPKLGPVAVQVRLAELVPGRVVVNDAISFPCTNPVRSPPALSKLAASST